MIASAPNGVNSPRPEELKLQPAHPSLLESWLRLLVEPGSVVELRALGCSSYPNTVTGYFDDAHLGAMSRSATEITVRAEGVYFTINPIDPDLLARASNRTQAAKKGESTPDKYVLRRRWLLIDVDPERVKGISATDAEKAQAWEVLQLVRRHLDSLGYPPPIVADSGNGYHAFYRIDCPADDAGLLKRVLQSLAVQFNTGAAKIDVSVFNPSRIVKIPGTLSRKGDSTPDRPHRCSRLIEVPGCLDAGECCQLISASVQVVPVELLEALADQATSPRIIPVRPSLHHADGYKSRLLVARWLADRGVAFTEGDLGDGRKFVLDHCPFNPDHKAPDAAIFQFASGAMTFKCLHNSCVGNAWRNAKDAIGPPETYHFDPPLPDRARPPTSSPSTPEPIDPPSECLDAPADPDPAAQNDEPCPRPEIVITTYEHEVTDQAVAILVNDPDIYTRVGALVRLQRVQAESSPSSNKHQLLRRPIGAPQIRFLPPASLRERITRFASVIKYKMTTKGPKAEPAHPPEWLVAQVHARGEWPCLRPLDGVIECPTLRSDGSILDCPGYDASTALLYEPNGMFPPVPLAPTRDEALKAADRLLELVCDFPFAGPAHKAAWLAALLSMIARTAIDGCSPLFLFDASVAVSGKTKLADLISTIANGRRAPVTPCPQEDDEMRKLITSVVLAGDRMLLLDNLDQSRRLGSAGLDAVLTAGIWTERILGKSEKTAPLPVDTVFMASGNNVGLRGDMHRRVLPCRLEPQCENPEERDGWKFPDLLGHAKIRRGGYVRDALTILRAYVVAGRPVAAISAWGGYEAWSNLIRQAIYWTTTVDPCETRQDVQAEDAGSEQLADLLLAWAILPDPEQPRSVADVRKEMECVAEDHPLRQVFAGWSKDGKIATAHTIGNKLARFRGRICEGRRLDRQERRSGSKSCMWSLQTIPDNR